MGAERTADRIFGRSDEVRSLLGDLDQSRLVTLLGPGGVGKTRLAAEVAGELETDLDRVILVELSNASSVDDVIRAAAEAVVGEGSADIHRIVSALDVGPSLVILDSCEHVLDHAAMVVATVLAGTALVRVLATSRRPLALTGEVLRTIGPLALADPGADDAAIAAAPATRLFAARAAATSAFAITASNRQTVAEICAAAGGLPLALELAAALVRTTPLDDILRTMRNEPGAIGASQRDAPEQHRSLRASLDWSRRFLSPAEAATLDRLAVLEGSFTGEAARSLVSDDIGDTLATLVDHSLVGFDPSTGRYQLLDVIRLEVASRLEPAERSELEKRHFAWCETVVDHIERTCFAPDPDNRSAKLQLDLPDLCAAVRRCHRNGDMSGVRRLTGPIAVWWAHHQPVSDPEGFIEVFDGPDVPPRWRANATAAIAYHWSHRGDHARARALASEAVAQHRSADDPLGEALAQLAVANAELEIGDRSAAETACRAALTTATANGVQYPHLLALVILARVAPEDPATDERLAEARRLARHGFPSTEAFVLAELASRALGDGREREAGSLASEALGRARSSGSGEPLATALCAEGAVAAANQDWKRAAAAFTEALAIGRRLSHAGLIERATAGIDRSPAIDLGLGPEPLTERELAVARLLRGDLTQQEIADELYVAPSTVKTHVKAIYRKLGVTKRSHAVTRAAELGLFGQAPAG